ncbi:MAG: RecQ family ATP-dependent DNA helicase [bacterium]
MKSIYSQNNKNEKFHSNTKKSEIYESLKTIKDAAKYLFDIDSLKEIQIDIIQNILNGNDIFAILPTAFGKSLCYIIPGVIIEEKTLVISPLIQLMNDQANLINKNLGKNKAIVLSNVIKKDKLNRISKAKFVFTSPEKFENDEKILRTYNFRNFVIDEAHCLSLWSDDFRPAYSRISKILKRFMFHDKHKKSLISFTATADKYIKQDIMKQLPFRENNLKSYNMPCFKSNISIYTISVNSFIDKILYLNYYLSRIELPAIIYCATKNNVDIVYEFVKSLGYNTQKYHSKLIKDKDKVLNRFLNEDNLVTVSTNALGMGVNKKNLRYVIHFTMPASPELYIQEVGRAGRDNLPASGILLYDENDKKILNYLINKAKTPVHKYKKIYTTLNRTQGRTCSSIAYISNMGIKETNNILNKLKDANIAKKINKLYYKNKKFNIQSLNKTDIKRYMKNKKLNHMITYCKTSNENNWKWLLDYMGYEISKDEIKSNEFFANDWIIQKVENLDSYMNLINTFLNNFHPNIEKTKYHLGGYSLYFYLNTKSDENHRTELGYEIYQVKYGKKEKINKIWINKSAEFIKTYIPKDIDYFTICPSSLTNSFMDDFANSLEKVLKINGKKIKFAKIIEKIRETRPQKNMKNISRKIKNIKNAFAISEKHYKKLKGKNILLIDDIYDSGATINECAKTLKNMDVNNIFVFTLLKTIR